jgi:hypothetical protein
MPVLLLTALIALWAAAAILAISLCVIVGRSDRTDDRGPLRLVSSR